MTDQSTREPAEIRRDIESTRVEMGDTVEALAEKADVKAQAQRKAADVQEKVVGARQSVVQKARENPIPVAVAGALAAALILRRIAKH
jgi:Protein of unknown function (DUF3618)